ncbi:MAG TPA: J domain-containing protein [Methylomirabilota bacterium]|nr:J domain-containing protein [Methylomirabilota bacterium]
MSANRPADDARVDLRDYYAVLGAEPSASVAELRAAFREAVLRHHPDRSAEDSLATRRTSVLNRAWSELRDPVRRLHYDHALERGNAATLAWPLSSDEQPSPSRRQRHAARPIRTPWHTPEFRSVHGFRVPTQVFMAGPAAQRAWIVANHIEGQDWREHRERYWLRFAASFYHDRGRTDDWLGALERLVELDGGFETLVRADLRSAYVASREFLRGVGFLRSIGQGYAAGSPQRRWIDRELRALLGEYRDARVRKGRAEDRAEAAELLLNYLEALEMPPAFADVRAAIMAHVRAGHAGRAAELLERAVDVPITEPARWFSMVQLLTEGGQLDRASAMLAEIARGEHPEALDRRKLRGDPARRISAARVRLERARERAAVQRAREAKARARPRPARSPAPRRRRG